MALLCQPDVVLGNISLNSESENSFDQADLYFYVNARHKKSANHTTLKNATNVADFVEYYPSSWITDYVSVAVHTTSYGRQKKAVSTDAKLTTEQKEILRTADMFTDVVVHIKHKITNSITMEITEEAMNLKIHVRQEVEAKFPQVWMVFDTISEKVAKKKSPN